MKKKLRKIIVDEMVYFWCVRNPNCDGDYGCELVIYHNKKVFHKGIVMGSKTPKDVRATIIELKGIRKDIQQKMLENGYK